MTLKGTMPMSFTQTLGIGLLLCSLAGWATAAPTR